MHIKVKLRFIIPKRGNRLLFMLIKNLFKLKKGTRIGEGVYKSGRKSKLKLVFERRRK